MKIDVWFMIKVLRVSIDMFNSNIKIKSILTNERFTDCGNYINNVTNNNVKLIPLQAISNTGNV